MSKKQDRSRGRKKNSKYRTQDFENTILSWVKEVDTTQPSWEEWEKSHPSLWPSKSVDLPEVSIAVSVYIPPLLAESEGVQFDPVEWDLSVINRKWSKWEIYRKYKTKEEILKVLSFLSELIDEGYYNDWEWFNVKFKDMGCA